MLVNNSDDGRKIKTTAGAVDNRRNPIGCKILKIAAVIAHNRLLHAVSTIVRQLLLNCACIDDIYFLRLYVIDKTIDPHTGADVFILRWYIMVTIFISTRVNFLTTQRQSVYFKNIIINGAEILHRTSVFIKIKHIKNILNRLR